MNGTLPGVEGARVNRELSQFFTPDWLARKVAKWACAREKPEWVLEPSAGRGALIKALDLVCESNVSAVDIDAGNCSVLRALIVDQTAINVYARDFLAQWSLGWGDGEFDLALMNPPYEDNQDVRFIQRALDCSDRVVGIFQSRIVHSKGRAPFWAMHDIQRMAILSDRPSFGGEHSAKTDFVVLEITRRQTARKQGEATPAQVEWWSR